jgi:hypothetical protein
MGRLIRPVMLLAGVILLLSSTSGVEAAGGLLRQRDAPPGFGALHSKVYTAWAKTMKVVTRTKGLGKSTYSCDVPKAYRADGWIRGLIQVFESPGLLNDFDLCENMFSTSAGAQSAYVTAAGIITREAAKVKGMKRIPGVTIGDASEGVSGARGGFVTAAILFRHGAAVVTMIYLGTGRFTGAAFVQTARRANDRIP